MIPDGAIVDAKYRILRSLGGGAMGKVFLAEKVSTHERFAIKFIHDYLISDDVYCARFEREVNALRGIRHPHVVGVYDWKLPEKGKGGNAYIVMEYLEGEPLQQTLMRPTGISVLEMTRAMLQVLDGLTAVHALGIIHRDLGPANIFLVGRDADWRSAKILDFGLAKGEAAASASDNEGGVTQDGAVLGRAAYAAPEMFLGVELDERADVFACGMMMYRGLAHRFPYRESKTELMWVERYSQRFEEGRPYTSARAFNPSIPVPVDRIISKAIRKRPSDRYRSAGEMQADLLEAEAAILRLPRVEGPRASDESPTIPDDMGGVPTATTIDHAFAAGGGSPTPGPAHPGVMPSMANWLAADGSGASASTHARVSAPKGWMGRQARGSRIVAAVTLGIGVLAVLLALVLRGGPGGQAAVGAAAPGAADAAIGAPVDSQAARDGGVAPAPSVSSGDAGAHPVPDAVAVPAVPDAAGVVEAVPRGVKVALAGLPDGATATVDGVPVVDGVATVARSDGPVPVKATAPGFLDFESELVPSEDMMFFVFMDEVAGDASDVGAAQPPRPVDAGFVRPPRPVDAGVVRPPPPRDVGAVSDVPRPPRPPGTLDGGTGIGIIVNYDDP